MGTRARWNAITPDTQEKAELNTYVGGGPLLHVQDQKPSGTGGGSASAANTFLARELNTVLTNEIDGASLASNQITLPAGTYDIDATLPTYEAMSHKARLQDVTNGSELVTGTTSYSDSTNNVEDDSFIRGRFTLQAAATVEVQHLVDSASSSNTWGTGYSVAAGNHEVYADVRIWKIG